MADWPRTCTYLSLSLCCMIGKRQRRPGLAGDRSIWLIHHSISYADGTGRAGVQHDAGRTNGHARCACGRPPSCGLGVPLAPASAREAGAPQKALASGRIRFAAAATEAGAQCSCCAGRGGHGGTVSGAILRDPMLKGVRERWSPAATPLHLSIAQP